MSESAEMELVVNADGGVKCIYDDALGLWAPGELQITRASHVEPDLDGNWWADMVPVGAPVLAPFRTRWEALAAERGGARRQGRLPVLAICYSTWFGVLQVPPAIDALSGTRTQ